MNLNEKIDHEMGTQLGEATGVRAKMLRGEHEDTAETVFAIIRAYDTGAAHARQIRELQKAHARSTHEARVKAAQIDALFGLLVRAGYEKASIKALLRRARDVAHAKAAEKGTVVEDRVRQYVVRDPLGACSSHDIGEGAAAIVECAKQTNLRLESMRICRDKVVLSIKSRERLPESVCDLFKAAIDGVVRP